MAETDTGLLIPEVTVSKTNYGWVRIECGKSYELIHGTRLLELRINRAKNSVRRQEIRRLRGERRFRVAMEKLSDD